MRPAWDREESWKDFIRDIHRQIFPNGGDGGEGCVVLELKDVRFAFSSRP